MTPAEINEAVARKLGGDKILEPMISHTTNEIFFQHPPAKNYCQSIAAAWEVVEFVISKKECNKWVFDISSDPLGEYLTATIHNNTSLDDPYRVYYQAEFKTAPMAICLAFLKVPRMES